MERIDDRGPFVCGDFRDISEYRTAFAQCHPRSHPESRPWLENHLEQWEDAPSSAPVHSLLHWIESRNPPVSQKAALYIDQDVPKDRQFDEDETESPYGSSLLRSASLDLSFLDEFDP
jgi:hypothetical protein